MKSVRIQSFYGPYFPAYALNLEIEPPTKFSKGGSLDRTQFLEGGLLGEKGVAFFREELQFLDKK